MVFQVKGSEERKLSVMSGREQRQGAQTKPALQLSWETPDNKEPCSLER